MPGKLLVGEVEALAGMDDRMTPALKGLRGQLGDFSRKAGVAMGAASAYALKAGHDFEQSRKTIAEGTGATGEALEGLTDSFRNLAGTIPGIASPAVASAIADLNTHMGVTGGTLEDLAAKALKAGVDTNTFGGYVKQAGLDSAGASALLDDLTAASQKTGVGVDELVGRAGKLSARWIQAKGDTEGLIETVIQAADEFGPAGLRGALSEIGAELDRGTVPAFQSLDTQLGDTAGAVERTHQAGITFTERLGAMKDRASALIGPFGSVAGGIGSVASAAALAGPQVASMGASIATKVLPFLAGPAGLVLLVGAAAAAFISLRNEARNLDRQFADVTAKQELREEIRRLKGELGEAEEAAERTTVRMGTFGSVTSDVANARVTGLRYSLRQAEERLEELETQTDDATAAVQGFDAESSILAGTLTGSVNPAIAGTVTNLRGLFTRMGQVQGKFGQLTAEQLLWSEGLVRDIEQVSDASKWEGIGTGAGEGVGSGLLASRGQLGQIASTLGGAFGNSFLGVLGNVLNAANPWAGLLAGASAALGVIRGLFGGQSSADQARSMGATRFRQSASGRQFYVNGQWVDERGNPVGGGTTSGTSGPSTPASPSTGAAPASSRLVVSSPSQPSAPPARSAPQGDTVVVIDGEVVARASRRHMPTVADGEGWA